MEFQQRKSLVTYLTMLVFLICFFVFLIFVLLSVVVFNVLLSSVVFWLVDFVASTSYLTFGNAVMSGILLTLLGAFCMRNKYSKIMNKRNNVIDV